MTLEGKLLRMAEGFKIPRQDFLDNYLTHELDPNWLDKVGKLPGKGWKDFAKKQRDRHREGARPRSRRSPTTPARRSSSSAACARPCRTASAR